MKLSILIPAYNEEATIEKILGLVKDAPLPEGVTREMVIVNDASSDNTDALIRQYIENNPDLEINYFVQPKNQGKGAALHKAIEIASGDYFVVQDADLEYDPNEFASLLKPVFKADADVVYGSRFIGDHPHRILFFLALDREQIPDLPIQHVHGFELDRHGDVLQVGAFGYR